MRNKRQIEKRKRQLEACVSTQQQEIANLKTSISGMWRVIKLTNENVDGISAFLKKPDWRKFTS